MKETDRKTLWIVSELFYPEETSTGYIMTKIADHLAVSKNVHVICGPIYDKLNASAKITRTTHRFELTRVKSLSLDKNKIFQRVLRLILLSIQLSTKLLFKAKKGDDVLIVTNPAPLVLLIVFVCKLRKLKCFTIVHDVFPENLVAGKILNERNHLYRFLSHVFRWAYSRMAVLMVLGRDMEQFFRVKLALSKSNPRIEIVENWGETNEIIPLDKKSNKITREHGLENKFVFLFAGNMGRLQGLLELMDVIARVKNPFIHFMFIGNGAVRSAMEDYFASKNISNVTFINSMPRSTQNMFLNACDVGLVSLQEGMAGLGVPSKSYNILAAGKPILFLGDEGSEIAKMVLEHKIGWAFNKKNQDSLVQYFNKLSENDLEEIRIMGMAARNLAVSRYSEAYILDKYRRVVDGQ